LQAGLSGYFPSYNEERIHAALDLRWPWLSRPGNTNS